MNKLLSTVVTCKNKNYNKNWGHKIRYKKGLIIWGFKKFELVFDVKKLFAINIIRNNKNI